MRGCLVALSPTGKSGKYISAHRVRTNTDCTSGCAFSPFKIFPITKKPGHDTSELQAAPTAPESMDKGGQVGLVGSKVHGGGCEASSVQLQNCPAMKEDLYSTDTCSNTTSQGLLKHHFQHNRNSMTLLAPNPCCRPPSQCINVARYRQLLYASSDVLAMISLSLAGGLLRHPFSQQLRVDRTMSRESCWSCVCKHVLASCPPRRHSWRQQTQISASKLGDAICRDMDRH
ncbi:hypothetical protein BKA56DRAFT_720236 [Ilyonectria sp. MPI-CAGE-AT-0026]|nr:hypothetical protein BKA56DRAFT_720236 [Ilyonectria sp. MPI-CAGE-AT-0026]